MPNKNAKSISVRGAEYERFQAAADQRGMSVAELVETACADLPAEPAAVAALCDRVWANMPRGSRTVRGG
jgi:hypothetical protein